MLRQGYKWVPVYTIPIFVCFILTFIHPPILASPTYASTLTASVNSVVANGSSATFINLRLYDIDTNSGIAGQTINFTATGEGNKFSNQSGSKESDGPSISVVTDNNGNATTVLRSYIAGNSTITASMANDTSITKSVVITFVPVITSPPPPHMSSSTPSNTSVPPTSTTQKSSNTSTKTPPAAITKPAAPTLTSLKIAGHTTTVSESMVTDTNTPIEMLGTAVPNGTVALYIYTDQKPITIRADSEGRWTYTIASLAPGTYHIMAEVTNPQSRLVSTREQLVRLMIEPEITQSVKKTPFWRTKQMLVALLAIAIVSPLSILYASHIIKKDRR